MVLILPPLCFLYYYSQSSRPGLQDRQTVVVDVVFTMYSMHVYNDILNSIYN